MLSRFLTESLERRLMLAVAPAGPEFRVNTYTANLQQFPAVAMDAAGGFVVTWQGTEPTGLTGVYARSFDSSGGSQGLQFKVNTTVPGFQRYVTIAMDADGDFVIAWASFGQDPGDTQHESGVYAQRYAEPRPPGAPRVANVYVRGQTVAGVIPHLHTGPGLGLEHLRVRPRWRYPTGGPAVEERRPDLDPLRRRRVRGPGYPRRERPQLRLLADL